MILLKNLISIMSLEKLYSIFEYSIGIRKPQYNIGDTITVRDRNVKGIIVSHKEYSSKIQQSSYHLKTEFKYRAKLISSNKSKILSNGKTSLLSKQFYSSPCLLCEKKIN